MNHDIFISYSSKQKSIADGVCHYLEENGFKCWMAPRDIPVGSEYGDLIEEAIKTCKAVVLVFSEAASISKWVKGEINVAFAEDKPILPFRVDETAIKGGFRVMLNQMHWIDAYPHYADRLPDLLISISGLLGKPAKSVNVQGDMPKRNEAIVANPNRSDNPTNSFNGHEYVDLGLPSGTLWATCNIGANKPEDYGDYFALEEGWGDYLSMDALEEGWDDYLSMDEGKTVAAKWGNGWQMPSKEQWEELVQNTNSIWTTRNGVNGRLFTASNGKDLFLPAAGLNPQGDPEFNEVGISGCYWASSLYLEDGWLHWIFAFWFDLDNYGMEYYGAEQSYSVRAVCELQN